MKTIKIFTSLILLILIFSCNSKDKIIGEWESYGDLDSRYLVKIEKFGELYQGSAMNLVDEQEIYGWQIGDICWKNITLIEKGKYKAAGVQKGFEDGKPRIREVDIILELENENTLTTKNFVTDITLKGEGKKRSYKRIK